MRALVFSLMVPALCLAQAPQPQLTFEKTHHDFGKIGTTDKAVYRFKVTNTGKANLNISRLNPSCGCTSTVIGQWTLLPGQSTAIEATFNPAGYRGMVHKSIQVVSDDPVNPTANLTFEAEVVRAIIPSTESIFFGDVMRNVPRKMTVKFSTVDLKPLKLLSATAPGAPWITATTRMDGNDPAVDITLDGAKIPAGTSTGANAVTVKTDNPVEPVVNLTIQWDLRAVLVATPVRVAWVEPAGKEQRMKVSVKHADGKPYKILSAKLTNPLFKVEGLDKGSASTHEFQVVLSSKAKAGNYNEKLLLATDSPEQPELELRLVAALK